MQAKAGTGSRRVRDESTARLLCGHHTGQSHSTNSTKHLLDDQATRYTRQDLR